MSPTYYQPANKLPLGGAFTLLLGGVLAAAGLALVYIYAVWYIPFVYINFVLCLGFGFLLGFVLAQLVRVGKLRHPAAVTGLGLLVGLAAVYLEWAIYLTLMFNAETTGTGPSADTSTSFSISTFTGLLTHPGIMLETAKQLNETGTWSLKGTTPSGIFLALIWLVEAVIIVAGACLLARIQATEPFSEVSQEWADEETMPQTVAYAADPVATRTALETGRFEHLAPYTSRPAVADQFARVTLHTAPNDPACHYLTVQNVTRTLDKKGKATEATTHIVQHLAISPTASRELKKRFGQLAPSLGPVGAAPVANPD